ncbi:glycerate kinase [Candidatus Aquicultor secundus]|nr:glycerate kinase [Candidatus Aquicultor secundus]PIU27615.1 MAG: glycerate kinase [Candidatus Aquicultor secundus]
MKIVVAPDKFKGTASAKAVARAIADGIKEVLPEAEIVLVPMADGGEGTMDALLAAVGGRIHEAVVTGPLGKPAKAPFGILADGTAVIEMAKASGFELVPAARRDPTVTTTYGTGELIEAALDFECRRFIVGIGGSATCDAGIGAAQALGVKILKEDGSGVGFGGGELVTIARIDVSTIDPRVRDAQVLVAGDVKNPLYGPYGAAHVFAPQKGASPEQVFLLEQGLIHFADVVHRDLGIDVSELSGGGAAGGLGAGLVAFLHATIRPGVELVMEAVGLRDKVRGADLVITGEGQVDAQSVYGKVPGGVAGLACEYGVKTIVIAGKLGDGYEQLYDSGISEMYALETIAGSLDAAINRPIPSIKEAASRIATKLRAW